jgi:hypothetical protein
MQMPALARQKTNELQQIVAKEEFTRPRLFPASLESSLCYLVGDGSTGVD